MSSLRSRRLGGENWIEKRLALEASRETVCPIPAVEAGARRPLWSVMIPTHNCAGTLRQTLFSVLAQDPGPDLMQVEVVDDCSTKDDPEAVVLALGGGRVAFHRQPANGGAIRNFNTCVLRSRGRLVHILHGDDLVEPGFYRKMGALAERHSDVAVFIARAHHINEDGVSGRQAFGWGIFSRPSPFLPQLGRPTDRPGAFFYGNPVRTPGVVVRRQFYEQHGGFVEALMHCADWEMWLRAICRGRGLMTREILTRYRVFAGSDTSKLARAGENLRDPMRLASILVRRHAGFDFTLFRTLIWFRAALQARKFARMGDAEAAEANRQLRDDLAEAGLPARELLKLLTTSAALAGQTAAATARAIPIRPPRGAEIPPPSHASPGSVPTA